MGLGGYVVAFDSSGNGTYYAVVLCDDRVFKDIMESLTRVTSKYHVVEVRFLRGKVVKAILDRVGHGLVAICMYVHLPEIKSFIRNLSPRLSKKRVERVAYKAIGRVALAMAQKYLPKEAEVMAWYADRGDAAEILRLVGIKNLYVSKEYSFPADVIAWLNYRGETGKVIELDVRSLVQMYAREILKVQKK